MVSARSTCLLLSVLTLALVRAEEERRPLRVGVLHFENLISPRKITSTQLGFYNVDPQYDYLEKALPGMLYTDLANLPAVELIERAKIEELLSEIEFNKTGLVDEKTIRKMGRGMKCDYLIYGSIGIKRGEILIKPKVEDIFQAQTIALENISAPEDKLLALQEELSGAVAAFLEVSIKEKKLSTREEGAAAVARGSSLAVLPFNNNSKKPDSSHLSKGLAETFSSVIPGINSFKLVERARIEKVIQELALAQTGVIDEKTGAEIGRILGAEYLLVGSFLESGGIIRIDTRVVDVETGQALMLISSQREETELFKSVSEITETISKRIKRNSNRR